MPPHPPTRARRSRRLSYRAPVLDEPSPAPSACTTSTGSGSPPAIVTHLPFAPGSSHTRNRKEGHIPRPPNAFMVFRSWLWNTDNLKSIERDNRNVSRIAGRYWNELSEADRTPFRIMAEEAKARHAQLYPQYRYSPTSQKKPKATQRRSARAAEVENEKCKKVVDMLLTGAKTGEEQKVQVPQAQGAAVHTADSERTSTDLPGPVLRNGLKRSAPAVAPRAKKQRTLLPSPPISAPYMLPLSTLPTPDWSRETTPMPGPAARTPELAYPPLPEFVPTDQIPHLSLDSINNVLPNKTHDEYDLPPLFPQHLLPAAQTVFTGVKPEMTSFVDLCMFGAYNHTDALLPPTSTSQLPFADFDLDPYTSLVPLGSPVFSNPFEPSTISAEQSALNVTLDQLFGQPISPHNTTYFSTENW